MPEKEKIEKRMSSTLPEFHRSLQRLAPELTIGPDQREVSIPYGEGHILIRYDERPPRTLGGLLSVPDAIVTLTVTGLSESELETFLARFDKTFQRGGG